MFNQPISQVITTTVNPDGTYGICAGPAPIITNPVPSLVTFILIFCMMACAPLSYIEDEQRSYTERPQITTLQTAPGPKKEAATIVAAPHQDASMNMNLFPWTGSSSSSKASGIKLLPQSRSQLLTREEIFLAIENSSYSRNDFLKLAALEITAANGDTLADKGSSIQQYFNDQEWYSSIPDKHIVTPEELSYIETENINLLYSLIS